MKKNKFLFILYFFVIGFIFIFVLEKIEKNEIDILSKQRLESTQIAYNSILDTYKLAAKKDFNFLMKQEKILKLLHQFKYGNNKDKNVYRGLLYRALYKDYEILKSNGIRQFHFHTHKGESLLRFHNPSNSADSLIDLRESINIANTKLKTSFGFEGGRVYPGFRYVFPIVYKEDHLGSVEFSISFDAVEKKLNSVLSSKMHMLLMNDQTTLKKVFNSKKKYFEASVLFKDYYIENSLISSLSKKYHENKLIKSLDNIIKDDKRFLSSHQKHKSFYLPILKDDRGFMVTFLAVYDTKKMFAGYIVSYMDFEDLVNIANKYDIFKALGLVLIALFVYLISIAVEHRSRTIKNKKELEKSNINLQNIIDNQKNLIIIYEDSEIITVNQKFRELFTDNSFCSSSFENMILDTNEEDYVKKVNLQDAISYKNFSKINNKMLKIYNTLLKKEQTYLININFYSGNNSFILVLTDISELINLQRIVYTQSKIAAVGEMIGNIAHQWRQPLSVITTCVTGLKFQLEYNDDFDKKGFIESFDRVNFQAKYLSKTIDDFRNFFKDDGLSSKEFKVNELIEKVFDITKDSLKANYINVQIDTPEVSIFNNDSVIVQALINIINNAKDAFLDKNISSDDRYLFISLNKKDDCIVIKVIDSAGGIDESIIDKIFDPYFTTKHQSVGTGIGLYMTHQLITKQLKGKILVKNKTYKYNNKSLKGAQFKIEIPIEI
ncbi:ATP-binding protein [Arcobacter roscoffensis]|uniref:histidine kinase n=1 Tax=Arcobacter roscoffensis TaxID=2961520 RepID=A0ABY5E3J9_9BACT|nr:ATP-binding protein [Arcobacter roscoffensis]UTJ05740.1 ATP-binding protein [Arcobacter roscoffensis]